MERCDEILIEKINNHDKLNEYINLYCSDLKGNIKLPKELKEFLETDSIFIETVYSKIYEELMRKNYELYLNDWDLYELYISDKHSVDKTNKIFFEIIGV